MLLVARARTSLIWCVPLVILFTALQIQHAPAQEVPTSPGPATLWLGSVRVSPEIRVGDQ